MAYRVELSSRADRQFRKFPAQVRDRLQKHIDALAENPRPHGVRKLEGDENAYRIRVGDYRILYEIHDQVLVVIVLKVADRKEAYG